MNLQEQIYRIQEMMILNESKGWVGSKKKLERTFKFESFEESIDFVNKVAKIAEKQAALDAAATAAAAELVEEVAAEEPATIEEATDSAE
jgi:hypothetical protein